MSQSQFSLWLSSAGVPPEEVGFPDGAVLSADGRSAAPFDDSSYGAVGSAPVAILPSTSAEAPAVAIVAGGSAFELKRNGAPLRPGIHLLRHADRLDFGDRTAWLSAEGRPVECDYDPEVHGRDVHCLRTKARLRPGEPIVICPGTAAARCGSIFRKAAWDTGLPCHACGFDPARPRWRPPVPRKESVLDELLRLVVTR